MFEQVIPSFLPTARHKSKRRFSIVLLVALGVLLAIPPAAFAQVPVTFAPATNFAAGDGPCSVAIGDLNRDGKADLVTTNINSTSVSVLLGDGAGGFGTATNYAVGVSPHIPRCVAIGDVNRDGKADLVTANGAADNVSVLLGDGTGGFGAATNYAAYGDPHSVAIGDLNRDGNADLVTANAYTNNVLVLLGDGSGGFGAATSFATGSYAISVAIGDLNRDGKADLAVANAASDNVSVLLGDGAGGFGAATNLAAGTTPVSVAIGDLNRDGKADLAVANVVSDNVSVLLGDGTGGFGAATNFHAGDGPYSVAIGDLNRDGKADLVTPNINSDNVSVLLGYGTGGFGAATNFAVGENPIRVAIGDLNQDGNADLVTANNSSDNVSILLNNSDSTPPTTTAGISGTTGDNGWYVSNVAVTLDATDGPDGSGVATTEYSTDGATWNTYTGAVGITDEGETELLYRSTDNEGNVEETRTTTVKVDKMPPAIDATTPANGGTYLLNQPVFALWSAGDLGSGLAWANGTVASGAPIDTALVGSKAFLMTARDNAGNETAEFVTYDVRYGYSGILQPINADGSSIFKLGRTVPVKFRLTNATGAYMSGAVARIYVARISSDVVGDEAEAVSTAAATEGNLFRYDSDANQYIFNWGTKGLSAGTWRIRTELDDGSSKYVTVSLR